MKRQLIVAGLGLAAAVASPPHATAADVAGVFGRGRTHFVVSAGSGYAFRPNIFRPRPRAITT